MSKPKPEFEQIPGTNVFFHNPRETAFAHRLEKAIRGLTALNCGNDRRNVHQRLTAYRTLSEDLLDAYETLNSSHEALRIYIGQIEGGAPDQARRRWTAEQDEALVDLACKEGTTMIELATSFRRTPAAISSRLSYLVGVSRMSRHVVGRITGYLDGEPVAGFLDADLR